MAHLYITFQEKGYTFQDAAEVRREPVEGGPARSRRDLIDSTSIVNVSAILTAEEYEYLMAFYRRSTEHGSLSFTVDLVTNKRTPVTVTAYFVPDTLSLVRKNGATYEVTARLEVEQDAINASLDAALLA